MGKILGSWSGMRKYLEEEMIAECLRGRVRYGCTAYKGMDGCRIFEVCIDGKQVKRFSWETVNSYFIGEGLKSIPDPYGITEYWDEFQLLLNQISVQDRTEYTDEEFCQALETYRNQNIRDSIASDHPLIKMFAVLDRRIGNRTLKAIRKSVEEWPEWLQEFYHLRAAAE